MAISPADEVLDIDLRPDVGDAASAVPTRRQPLIHAVNALLILAATFFVFAPSLWNGFVNWDDTTNFLNNPHYRGLGWKNLRWMATTFLMGQWIPLTWLTLGLDYVLWGMNPFGYHLTNLILHAATAAAWYLVARRLLALSVPTPGRTRVHAGFRHPPCHHRSGCPPAAARPGPKSAKARARPGRDLWHRPCSSPGADTTGR